MPLRIGFDMDGVLADFGRAFHDVEARLFGGGSQIGLVEPDAEEAEQAKRARRLGASGRQEDTGVTLEPTALDAYESEKVAGLLRDPRALRESAGEARRRRDIVWRNIQDTPDFWFTLRPIDDGAVRRIHEMMLRHRWEVFFITQRPDAAGDTVQRQTQRWLADQGFDLPSVLVLGGSRGAAAGALRLDYHVDDNPQNCLDVISNSSAKPILIVPDNDEASTASARKLGIGTARTIAECLDILEKATAAHTQPGLLRRLASIVGWR